MKVTRRKSMLFGVVDLFAGPGGLAEGFSRVEDVEGNRRFDIALSVEKDPAAHETLLLRTFLRRFNRDLPKEYLAFLRSESQEPEWGDLYPEEWGEASKDALRLEISSMRSDAELDRRLEQIADRFGDRLVLIGGPPCQAYSLIGRARNAGNASYDELKDSRHTLYKAYIRILSTLEPAAFVMENVKGILSSKYQGARIVNMIVDDLERTGRGYRLFALNNTETRGQLSLGPINSDYVVRSENHGVPQKRHRVIIVGIRSDLVPAGMDIAALQARLQLLHLPGPSLRETIGDMPALRSGLSGKADDFVSWRATVSDAMSRVAELRPPTLPADEVEKFVSAARHFRSEFMKRGFAYSAPSGKHTAETRDFDSRDSIGPNKTSIDVLPNHEARGHMPSDLERYFFASVFAHVTGRSPKAEDFPVELAPKHKNWDEGKFSDRFRVQVWDQPSTTVTSHISKDGHYYIHPDPLQCRSLTVREAARLQTFPDDYYFKGNRTQQYTQVGNAVPPLLAEQIARNLITVLDTLFDSQPA